MSNAPAVLATIARPIVSRSLEKIKIKKAGKNEVTRALQLHIYHNEGSHRFPHDDRLCDIWLELNTNASVGVN